MSHIGCESMTGIRTLRAVLGALLLIGCGAERKQGAASGESVHRHEPPHGGTGVVLGEEEYHLEFVLDAATGRMQAYILDAHMENFVRIPAEAFHVTAKLPDREEVLTFKAVASGATGETVGSTSLFETQADWLKAARSFDAVLNELTIKARKYERVAFNYPDGNEPKRTGMKSPTSSKPGGLR